MNDSDMELRFELVRLGGWDGACLVGKEDGPMRRFFRVGEAIGEAARNMNIPAEKLEKLLLEYRKWYNVEIRKR